MFPKVCDLHKESITEMAGCRLGSCVWHIFVLGLLDMVGGWLGGHRKGLANVVPTKASQ